MDSVKISIFLFLFPTVFASCWKDTVPGQYSKILDCSFQEWEKQPDEPQLSRMLDALFYVYLTDPESSTMKRFFHGLRQGTPPYDSILLLKEQLLRLYGEGLAQAEIQKLFLISQIDPYSIPYDISLSMHMSIYQQMETLFVLRLARRGIFGILPPGEYARILEIVKRMSWIPDPYLKSLNQYFQGLLYLHLGERGNAITVLKSAYRQLKSLSTKVMEKRILIMIAETSLLLDEEAEAEAAYLTILKADPQDWQVLMDLGSLLYLTGKCLEPTVWIEALMKPEEDQFALVIHCGGPEIPEEELRTEKPAIAFLTDNSSAITVNRAQYPRSPATLF